MRLFRILALSAALLSCSSWALGQDYHAWQYQDRDDRAAYREGYEQGRNDAQNGRRFRPDSDRYSEGDDRRAYRQGYESGFNSGGRRNDGDHDRDDRYRDNGGYGNGAYGNSSRVAEENGFRDGATDGRNDRANGHSFRPTQDDNYKKTPGYTSSMGNKQQYKDTYRQGYERGYQEGYNGGYRR